jgi:ATP-dependent Clp protease ATP-binding subunit ClpB
LFRMTNKGRQFLLEEGTDQRYGARHLKRAIESFLVGPLARLLATDQVRSGDVLIVDRHPGEKGLAFIRDTELRIASTQMPHAASYLRHLVTAEV